MIACTAVASHAHATLLHTEPQANARLSDAPEKVMLIFNERVEPIFNSIRVVDGAGQRVDRGEPRPAAGGEGVEIDLQPLREGPYGVLWRINSADGHQVQGRFGFGVRADAPDENSLPAVSGKARGPLWKLYMPTARWLSMTALVIWLGGIWFLLALYLPALRGIGAQPSSDQLTAAATGRVLALTWAGGALFVVAELLALAGQAATLADVSLAEALSPAVLTVVLGQTHYGLWWMIRMAAALALLALCAATLRRSHLVETPSGAPSGGTLWSIAATGLAGLVLASISLTGHASSVSGRAWLAVAGDWLHLAATALWIGGLVHFAMVVWILDRPDWNYKNLLASLASRFSNIAKICVGILMTSGIYNTWLHLPSWESFITTDYGRVLTAKLLLVLPILWIAAANLRRVLPALRDALPSERAQTWLRRFRKFVPAEAALGMMVLAVVAVLTSLPPAATVVAAGPIALSQRAGDFTVALRVDPNKVGDNSAVVTLTDSSGRRLSNASRVTIYLRSLDMDMGLETIQTQASPEGEYQARVPLSMAGKWLYSVEVSPRQGDTFLTEFRIPATL
jgi:copper transport protein